MNAHTLDALPASLHLPIEAPREQWPQLLDRAAEALQGRRVVDSESLALELRAIAEAIRMETNA